MGESETLMIVSRSSSSTRRSVRNVTSARKALIPLTLRPAFSITLAAEHRSTRTPPRDETRRASRDGRWEKADLVSGRTGRDLPHRPAYSDSPHIPSQPNNGQKHKNKLTHFGSMPYLPLSPTNPSGFFANNSQEVDYQQQHNTSRFSAFFTTRRLLLSLLFGLPFVFWFASSDGAKEHMMKPTAALEQAWQKMGQQQDLEFPVCDKTFLYTFGAFETVDLSDEKRRAKAGTPFFW